MCVCVYDCFFFPTNFKHFFILRAIKPSTSNFKGKTKHCIWYDRNVFQSVTVRVPGSKVIKTYLPKVRQKYKEWMEAKHPWAETWPSCTLALLKSCLGLHNDFPWLCLLCEAGWQCPDHSCWPRVATISWLLVFSTTLLQEHQSYLSHLWER